MKDFFTFMSDLYSKIGTDGVCFLMFVYMIYKHFTEISPSLKKINQNYAVSMELMRNMTTALTRLSESNENVANALNLLRQSSDQTLAIYEKHDSRSAKMERDLVKVKTILENERD